MAVKNVAIIGCGVAGLTSIKSCIDAGLKPICFEQQSSYGGVWNYTDESRPNLATVHSSTVTNLSKLIMGFSDFPFPKEFPNYLPHRLVQEYLKMYADNFDLLKYVQFNTEVAKLERSADYEETGKWVVSTRKPSEPNSEMTAQTFDAVMICNGHHWDQIKPDILGLEKFKGSVVHSGDYRTFHPYTGKRVVVVGCSHSGADIAVELSHHAAQVYIITRRGCYIFTRLGSRGEPCDSAWSRANQLIPTQIGIKLNPALLNNKIDFKNFGLQPTGTLEVQQFGIANDEIHHQIVTGSIKVKGEVREIRDNSVILQGGETLENIDAIVLATGFKPNYPFAKDIVKVKDDLYTSLHKHVFLTDDKWHTLSVIGAVGDNGPTAPISEIQARVVAEVLMGRCGLPSKEKMDRDIEERECWWLNSGASKNDFLRVGYIQYMDELGDMIGAKPNLWFMLLNDPKLAYQMFFGTAVPTQYRLQGPNTWKGARKHIMSLREQILHPLNTRKCAPSTERSRHHGILIFILVIGVAILAMLLK